MDIILLTVGKTADGQIADLTDRYIGRASHYVPMQMRCIPDLRKTKGLTAEKRRQLEGEAILSSLTPSDHVCLLDERGKELTSMEFSDLLSKRMASGIKRLVFVVGGPYGFSPDVYARADSKLSLSKMTFSHEMVRLFFAEQVYRAMTILRGEPYHHE
ncbi:MAG: 23S rRNA (pseudouridine(1915)-N(3))-methyltransferase RlmH [Muribaculaceae bacterium]|nr:23S rRNA (pseudouridine(1915)-N(3))-methyltransferase RlmH [Muribaculaceae bacterium]